MISLYGPTGASLAGPSDIQERAAKLTRRVHYVIVVPCPLPRGGGVSGNGVLYMAEEYKQGIINRLKSIEGHVRGVQRMVEEDAYCIDIMNQNLAVQRALERVNGLILERHLQTCVTTAIQGDDPAERERVIAEIMSVFEATVKV